MEGAETNKPNYEHPFVCIFFSFFLFIKNVMSCAVPSGLKRGTEGSKSGDSMLYGDDKASASKSSPAQ